MLKIGIYLQYVTLRHVYKEIGGEWLVKQAFETLEMDDNLAEIAQILFTTKLLHPSSELETECWLCENQPAYELYKTQQNLIRYKLYKAATSMYSEKEPIEKMLYSKIQNIFLEKAKSSYSIYPICFLNARCGAVKKQN